VQNDDDITPAFAAVARGQNLPIGNCKNRITEIAVFSADSIQVIAQMEVPGEWLRVVSHRTMLGPEWKIEPIGSRKRYQIDRRHHHQTGIELSMIKQLRTGADQQVDRDRAEENEKGEGD
jgi:hypothetical protein